jgi:endonuclease-3 related protein
MAARKTNQNENRRQQTAACHLRALYHQLAERFGPQQWWPAKSAFEVVVGAYLTQNTAWTSVERSIANLSARGALTPAGLRPVDETELRQLIRPSGFMLRKAAALKAFVAFLDAKYDGAMERLREAAAEDQARVREELLALPGVGNETADAILLYALGAPAMVVDEYLRRVTVRHGLLPEKATYREIQALAEAAFAEDAARESREELARHYNEFHALIVQIGKAHCGRMARCEGCVLEADLKGKR